MICTSCSAGYYSAAGASSCSACASAAAGTSYSPAGSPYSGCTATCPPGFACPTPTTSMLMTICAAGTYSQTSDTTTCAACPVGTKSPAGSSSATACTYSPPPPAYPSPPSPSPSGAYGGPSPYSSLIPFPPAPSAAPLPGAGTVLTPANVTTRKSGDPIVSVPQSTTLTLTTAACSNIKSFSAAFVNIFQGVTYKAWNAANPAANLQILQGDVAVPTATIQTFCASSRHRSLAAAGSSTVMVSASINTPPGTSSTAADAASASYMNGYAQKAYSSSDLSSTYSVSGASTFVTSAVSATYYDAPPPPPPGFDVGGTTTTTTTTNVGLVAGLSVGLFIAGAIIAGAAVFMVTRRGDQSVVPK